MMNKAKFMQNGNCGYVLKPNILFSKNYNLQAKEKVVQNLLYWNNCEAQARIGKGWQSRQKASKLKALPRAYIKIGCHPPTTTKSLFLLN